MVGRVRHGLEIEYMHGSAVEIGRIKGRGFKPETEDGSLRSGFLVAHIVRNDFWRLLRCSGERYRQRIERHLVRPAIWNGRICHAHDFFAKVSCQSHHVLPDLL